MPGDAIRLTNLTLGYGGRPVVRNVNGAFRRGGLTAVVGPNGAGKSTLLKAIAGVLRPLAGATAFEGNQASRAAYLPQAAEIDRTFPISVFDLVGLGLWRRTGLWGGFGRDELSAVELALETVGLRDVARMTIAALSGGQLQRALFARLLLQDAPIILLDEPLTAIDSRTAADLIALVRRWHAEGRTIVAVLHDLDIVRAVFPQALLLARGVIAWGETTDVLAPAAMRRAQAVMDGDYADGALAA